MLTLLVVGESGAPEGLPEPASSLEVLRARGAEEAVEKLGRNRRIDAVLVLGAGDAAAAVEAIREDVLAPPPIFLPAGALEIPGTRRLEAATLPALFEAVARALAGGI